MTSIEKRFPMLMQISPAPETLSAIKAIESAHQSGEERLAERTGYIEAINKDFVQCWDVHFTGPYRVFEAKYGTTPLKSLYLLRPDNIEVLFFFKREILKARGSLRDSVELSTEIQDEAFKVLEAAYSCYKEWIDLSLKLSQFRK